MSASTSTTETTLKDDFQGFKKGDVLGQMQSRLSGLLGRSIVGCMDNGRMYCELSACIHAPDPGMALSILLNRSLGPQV